MAYETLYWDAIYIAMKIKGYYIAMLPQIVD